jgi:mono/diheme cytochrome c family protein
MSKRPIVIFLTFAAICVVGIPIWALQTKGGADASSGASVPASESRGLELFQINCGACHTLAAAGTDGEIGPNLDVRFGTGPKSQLEKSTYASVLTTIKNGLGGRMPKGIVQGDQAKEVAQFVAGNVQYTGP